MLAGMSAVSVTISRHAVQALLRQMLDAPNGCGGFLIGAISPQRIDIDSVLPAGSDARRPDRCCGIYRSVLQKFEPADLPLQLLLNDEIEGVLEADALLRQSDGAWAPVLLCMQEDGQPASR